MDGIVEGNECSKHAGQLVGLPRVVLCGLQGFFQPLPRKPPARRPVALPIDKSGSGGPPRGIKLRASDDG